MMSRRSQPPKRVSEPTLICKAREVNANYCTVVFLERLTDMESLPHDLLTKMDELYQLTTIRNARIYPEVVQFVTEQGRMKFVRPLYRLLYKAKNGADLARDTYMKHRDFYHPIAGQLIEKDIGIKQ
jgi:hypothetical protein